MELGLTNKIAVVGASSKGLGKAIALGLAYEEASVTICARDNNVLEQTAEEIQMRRFVRHFLGNTFWARCKKLLA